MPLVDEAEDLWPPGDALPDDLLTGLVRASNLLGANRAVANFGGGNTSAKGTISDHAGRDRSVMWVKGSGSDLATAGPEQFTGLRLDEVLPLMGRGAMSDEEMVARLARCQIDPAMPRGSIETLLHAFVPAPHVHHTHPDAINVLAGEADGERRVRECFGDAAAWIPYIRPGFTLSRQVGEVVRANPALELVVLAKHGLVAWGDSAEQAYHRTIHATNTAARFVNARTRGTARFGGPATTAVAVGSEEARASLLHGLLPGIRGALSSERAKLLTVDTSPRTVELASSAEAEALVSVGAPCPDHLAHTKRVPLWIPYDPGADDAQALRERITERAEAYRHEYRAYVQQHADASVVPGDPDARVVLIQHLGMVTAGTTVKAARLSRDLYHRAIEVMAGAHALGEFVSLSAQESFAIEYWPLVLYKLSLAPPPGELQGQVAFVARAAGEIGEAIAKRLAAAGACVVGFDLDADETAEALAGLGDSALAVGGDVTDQASVRAAFAAAIGRFGGVDVVVSDAASITHFASVVRSEESTGVLLEVAGGAPVEYQVAPTFSTGEATVPVDKALPFAAQLEERFEGLRWSAPPDRPQAPR